MPEPAGRVNLPRGQRAVARDRHPLDVAVEVFEEGCVPADEGGQGLGEDDALAEVSAEHGDVEPRTSRVIAVFAIRRVGLPASRPKTKPDS